MRIGMPGRGDVEGAAELESTRLACEVGAEQDQVRQDLVALALEVVLGHPQGVVAELVHRARDALGHRHALDQALVGVRALVRRGAVEADVVECDVADVQDREFLDYPRRVRRSGLAAASTPSLTRNSYSVRMKRSTDRILTTHTGSLPRPPSSRLHPARELGEPSMRRLRARVKPPLPSIVQQQVEAGIDGVSDGEVGKPGYSTYVKDRLTGFDGPDADLAPPARLRTAPATPSGGGAGIARRRRLLHARPACDRPASPGRTSPPSRRDIANFKAALAGRVVEEVLHDRGLARHHRLLPARTVLPQPRGLPRRPGRRDEGRVPGRSPTPASCCRSTAPTWP